MIKGLDSILLFSESAKKLAHFYRDVVGLKITFEAVMGEHDEELYEFRFKKGATSLNIIDHSKVKGKSKDPNRFIFNLEVDDIKKEVARLVKAGAKLVQEIYHVESYGYVATFADIDGNLFQLVQVKG